MNVSDFLEKLTDALDLEEDDLEDENSMLAGLYTSLGVLSIIALCDEYFSIQLSYDQLQSISTVKSLMELIGLENFKVNLSLFSP